MRRVIKRLIVVVVGALGLWLAAGLPFRVPLKALSVPIDGQTIVVPLRAKVRILDFVPKLRVSFHVEADLRAAQRVAPDLIQKRYNVNGEMEIVRVHTVGLDPAPPLARIEAAAEIFRRMTVLGIKTPWVKTTPYVEASLQPTMEGDELGVRYRVDRGGRGLREGSHRGPF